MRAQRSLRAASAWPRGACVRDHPTRGRVGPAPTTGARGGTRPDPAVPATFSGSACDTPFGVLEHGQGVRAANNEAGYWHGRTIARAHGVRARSRPS